MKSFHRFFIVAIGMSVLFGAITVINPFGTEDVLGSFKWRKIKQVKVVNSMDRPVPVFVKDLDAGAEKELVEIVELGVA